MTEKTQWAAFFDEHAPQYEENCFTKNTVAEVTFLAEVLGVAPGGSILDVGCGTGRHAIELARRGYDVTGVDISAGMLEQARKNAQRSGVSVTWRQADAARFSVDGQFDAVICLCEGAFGLLSAQEDPIAQPLAIVCNVHQAMKPGAKCLFTVLSGLALIRKHTQADVEQGVFDPVSLAVNSEHAPADGHATIPLRERAFVPTELTLLFAVAGLRVLNIWGGTAGNWAKRAIDLDEIEIMVLAEKTALDASPSDIFDLNLEDYH